MLLALLFIDVPGPALPGFLSAHVANVLAEKFGIKPIGSKALTGVCVDQNNKDFLKCWYSELNLKGHTKEIQDISGWIIMAKSIREVLLWNLIFPIR